MPDNAKITQSRNRIETTFQRDYSQFPHSFAVKIDWNLPFNGITLDNRCRYIFKREAKNLIEKAFGAARDVMFIGL